jgi:hypothetical protein
MPSYKHFAVTLPSSTDSGNYGEMESCPNGHYVTSFNMKFQVWIFENRHVDDTALNGIKLTCSDAANTEITR